MRQGLGALLLVTLTMAVFVSPGLIPSREQSTLVPNGIPGQSPVNYESQISQISPIGVCSVGQDPLCSKCNAMQICPSRGLLTTIDDFFGLPEKDLVLSKLASDCGAGKPGVANPSTLGSQRIWGVPNSI